MKLLILRFVCLAWLINRKTYTVTACSLASFLYLVMSMVLATVAGGLLLDSEAAHLQGSNSVVASAMVSAISIHLVYRSSFNVLFLLILSCHSC